MIITFKEISIACAYKNLIEVDSLDRKSIKETLKNGYDEAPRYIEIPGPVTISIFDYFNNPLFPVQLNFQKNIQLFVLTGKADLDISEDKILKIFAKKYKELNDANYISLPKKAIGFNFLLSLQAEEGEKIFDDFSSKEFKTLLDDKGRMIAKGFRIIRIDKSNNQRIDFKADPIVPEIGKAFTYSYNLYINVHFQPVKPELIPTIDSKIIDLKKMILKEIEKI